MSHTYDIKYSNTLGAGVNADNLLTSRDKFSLGFGPNDRPTAALRNQVPHPAFRGGG